MPDPSAAALTEQERAQMNCDCHRVMGPRLGLTHRDSCFVPVVESILAARLADSRPVVSEAAIEAAAEALEEIGSIAPNWTPTAVAQIALTAALPHMGDGRGEAEHERVLQGVKDCWKVDMLENRLLRDGIKKLADELEQQHRDAFGESLADNFPSALVADLRALLRLSPTGDDSE